MRMNLVIHRYEAMVLILVLLLTGGINIVSTTTEHSFPLYQQYPYCVALTFDDGPIRATRRNCSGCWKKRISARRFS